MTKLEKQMEALEKAEKKAQEEEKARKKKKKELKKALKQEKRNALVKILEENGISSENELKELLRKAKEKEELNKSTPTQ